MEGDLGASDHRRAVPEPMAMRGGIGLVGTPEDAVDTPVAPGCSSYGPTPPRHGAHTREKRTTPRKIFVFGFGTPARIILAPAKINAFAGVFGVSDDIILNTRYTNKESSSLALSCDSSGL